LLFKIVKFMTFNSVAELEAWLKAKGMDTSRWGVGGAKSVKNLWDEINQGESQLQTVPPLRLVRVVNVIIRQGRRMLVETKQEFGENQTRSRSSPPAEKIKPGETPVEAAVRCLQEEMEVSPDRVKILAWTAEPEQIRLESPSYPGLVSNYILYEVEAKVAGLPRRPFSTVETAHDDGDPVKNHQWLWKPSLPAN
jgi:ADP-ribose pyrophosphatase YjhB (NUDIX family)